MLNLHTADFLYYENYIFIAWLNILFRNCPLKRISCHAAVNHRLTGSSVLDVNMGKRSRKEATNGTEGINKAETDEEVTLPSTISSDEPPLKQVNLFRYLPL